jgi:gas vesicle protein
MKKIYLLVILAAALMVSCNSIKTTTAQKKAQADEVLLSLDACEEYALEKPAKRASGVGMHFKEEFATNFAQQQARANLAKALQTQIITATEMYGGSHELFSADATSSEAATDQSAKAEDNVMAFAKEIITGAPMVKKTRYKTANNQFKVYVCVEYSEEIAEMAEKVSKKVTERLSQAQKARIDWDQKKFEEKMKDVMGDYKGATQTE